MLLSWSKITSDKTWWLEYLNRAFPGFMGDATYHGTHNIVLTEKPKRIRSWLIYSPLTWYQVDEKHVIKDIKCPFFNGKLHANALMWSWIEALHKRNTHNIEYRCKLKIIEERSLHLHLLSTYMLFLNKYLYTIGYTCTYIRIFIDSSMSKKCFKFHQHATI